MRVELKLKITEYINIVNDIVEASFGKNKEYTPYMGTLTAMAAFYNYCVKESRYKEELSYVDDMEAIQILINDREFINEFNTAIDYSDVDINFANAYKDALAIVKTKVDSMGTAIDYVREIINKFAGMVGKVINEENFEQIMAFVSDFIVDSYAKSQRFQEVVTAPRDEDEEDIKQG